MRFNATGGLAPVVLHTLLSDGISDLDATTEPTVEIDLLSLAVFSRRQ